MLKNKDKYKRRFYRQWIKAGDLFLKRIVLKETDIQVLTDKPADKKFLKEKVLIYRRQIEDYISKDRKFLTALKPLALSLNAPLIVKDMAQASKSANVGPMASVAGAIAQYLGEELLKKGFHEVIIENGGDIFLKINKVRYVSIYAGKSKLSNKLFLKIKPQDSSLGIATSSATVSHSLSFGNADAVTILADDAILADATATAACNLVKCEKDFKIAIDFARRIKKVFGIVIILKDKLASWGDLEFA